jgi:hypothetical protein
MNKANAVGEVKVGTAISPVGHVNCGYENGLIGLRVELPCCEVHGVVQLQ